MDMICEKCSKEPATFHVTEIDPDKNKMERHLCDKCAATEGFAVMSQPNSMLAEMEKIIAGGKTSLSKAGKLVCDECGLSYVEFRNHGLLGCPHDYDAFRELLNPLIERAHDGGTSHVGKTPKRLGGDHKAAQDLARCKRLLADAVAAEDYERAAKLRDKIQELESE
ncbi:MAG: UvrB/UvrC motif-containing protein [Phycisphaerales bacterium]|nr:UvrB/UvrC motif-containing protein [Phycisphaerales bacterium]